VRQKLNQTISNCPRIRLGPSSTRQPRNQRTAMGATGVECRCEVSSTICANSSIFHSRPYPACSLIATADRNELSIRRISSTVQYGTEGNGCLAPMPFGRGS
jgi:hypothetical protein